MSKNSITLLTTAALVLGGLLGILAGAYIVYAWLPANLLFTNMAPSHLAFDGVRPQYRDIYVGNVASRYQILINDARTRPNAVKVAQDLLGVTAGDITPLEATKIVSETLLVAKNENDKDGDAGWFTRVDETALANLLRDLRTVEKNPVSITPRDQSVWWNRLILLALLASLGIAVALGLYLLFSYLNEKAGKQAAANAQINQQHYADEQVPADDDQMFDAQDERYDEAGLNEDTSRRSNPANVETTQYAQSSATRNFDPESNRREEFATGESIQDDLRRKDLYRDDLRRPESATGEITSSRLKPATHVSPVQERARVTGEYQTSPTGSLTGSWNKGVSGMPNPASYQSQTGTQKLAPITYSHGDENLDEHYNILGIKDQVLGTCGVQVVERTGVAKPAEVVALALAVFDKVAMKTTYKILVTPGVYNDKILSKRLAENGELIPAQNDQVIRIDTKSLSVNARISQIAIENTPDPAKQYFKHVTVSYDAQVLAI